jgi:RsiW-degrading membrane proteinase PrsW (M82 family)
LVQQAGNYPRNAAHQAAGSYQNRFAHQAFVPNDSGAGKIIGIGGAVAAGLFVGLIVMVILVANLGIGSALIACVVAFLPASLYVAVLLFLDRYNPKPGWVLAGAFAWGSLLAVMVAYLINTIFGALAGAAFGAESAPALTAIFSAPFVEECTKGLGVLFILIFWRKEFDSVADGIVFAGIVALGFATVENVMYYGRGLNQSGVEGLALLFFLRGILSPFCHVLFTSMTGIGCGIARESHNRAVRALAPVGGYFAAVLLHAVWNTAGAVGGNGLFFVFYVLLGVPFFLGFVGLAVYLVRRQRRALREMLAVEVSRGLISREQFELAGSAFKRLRWVLAAGANWQQLSLRRRFLRDLTKLGFCHWHVKQAAASQGRTQSLQRIAGIQANVLALRHQIG